tara:strand:+ start:455 stop:1555 length:1101 start_codon:yes stop_codon:yes gene_type:complete
MKMNNSQIKVLLTASGGIHALGVIDCLKNNYEKRKIKIICTDIEEKELLRNKADGFYIVPEGNSKKFIKTILKICEKEKIDIIIPGNANEILSISKNIELFNSKNIKTTISNFNNLNTILNKEKTYSVLKKIGINIPEYYRVKNYKEFLQAIKELGYPKKNICFKPSKYSESGGTRGFRILRQKNTAKKIILNEKPDSVEIDFETTKYALKNTGPIDLLVMEYLPGDEFSTYVFADKGKMIYCISNLRQKLDRYYSFEAKIQKNKKIEMMCKKIVKELELTSNVNIQFKNSKNNLPKLIEINPRIGGTIILPSISGINLPYLAIKQCLNEKILPIKKSKEVRMIRYWKELFLQNSETFEINNNSKI